MTNKRCCVCGKHLDEDSEEIVCTVQEGKKELPVDTKEFTIIDKDEDSVTYYLCVEHNEATCYSTPKELRYKYLLSKYARKGW